MKNKLINFLKIIISKIIIPFQNKKEELLGNFRFSIAFRISLHYFKLLLISGVFLLLGIIILFYVAEHRSMNRKLSKSIEVLDAYCSTTESEIIINNPLYIDDITFRITGEDGFLLYTDIGRDIVKDSEESNILFNRIYYEFGQSVFEPTIIIYDTREIILDNQKYDLYVEFNMTEATYKAGWLLWTIGVLYIVIVYMIVRRGKISDLKLLEPITEMSNIANKLTANDLKTKRLNVDGTKNELKDLALVINNMLDRIELSYESQKHFVSDASHELRTPISVIQGYANLLNRWGAKDEEVLLESVEAISNEAKAMQDLVEKLLFLSRHDKKKLKLDRKKFHMSSVIEDMIKETKLVTSNRIIINEKLEDVIVYGDRQSLKQAIRIFIDNAIKYSKDGDSVTINCQNDNGDCIITIKDTGLGMKKKDAEHIFERFYRSDNVRDEKISGHGLGLSIAKLIILGHTGIIRVRTQFTKGTTFTIILPKRY